MRSKLVKLFEFFTKDWEIIGVRVTGEHITISFKEIPKVQYPGKALPRKNRKGV